MRESGWYPPGTEFDPNAPYNQEPPEEREFEIEATYELKRTDKVKTSDYDEDGKINNAEEVWEWQHIDPLDLIDECKRMAESELEYYLNFGGEGTSLANYLRSVIASCEGWELSYEEYE